MKELLEKLTTEVGLNAEQAQKALGTVVDFVKSKVPAPFADKIESMLGGNAEEGESAGIMDKAGDMFEGAKDKAGDMFENVKDKAENMFEGSGEKLENFAEQAGDKLEDLADKAGDMAKDAFGKIKGIFGK